MLGKILCAAMIVASPIAVAQDATLGEQTYSDWSGLYVGAHGGFMRASDDVTWPSNGPEGGLFTPMSFNQEYSDFIGGIVGGYNYQRGNKVFGIDADFGLTDAQAPLTPGSTAMSMDWNAHLRGRFGIVFKDAHLFVAAGVAVADYEASLLAATLATGSGSTTLYGPSFGVGAEVMPRPSTIIRVEYVYDHYLDDMVYDGTDLLPGPVAGTPRVDSSLDTHTFRAAIAFKFGQ